MSWYATDNQGTVRDVLQYIMPAVRGRRRLSIIHYDSFGQVTSQSSATDQPRFGDAGMGTIP